jgi:predicted phage terminase large subunit-like protein
MERLEFPELKAKAKELYLTYEPDACVIEAKASGLPLIFELRQMGIMVTDYTPARKAAGVSNDKIARTNAIADIFSSGKVWAPETRWADELIDNMAAFPNGSHDDDVDSAVMAITRFRQGGFLRLESDYEDNEHFQMARRAAYY